MWRSSHAKVAFALSGVLLGACDRKPPAQAEPAQTTTVAADLSTAAGDAVTLAGKECTRPLADYCRGAPCPTHAASVAALRDLIDRYKAADSGCMLRAELGTCGALQYVSEHNGYSGHTEYFDRSGTLVAAERSSDTNSFCDGKAFSARYGTHAACTQVVSTDLCKGIRRNDNGL